MSKTIRSACHNKPEDYLGFVLDVKGKDIVKQINAIVSSKRYSKAYRIGDWEAVEDFENEIDYLCQLD